MASSTSVKLTVKGVDRTRRVFAAVRANVALMASQVRAAGLAAAAGAAAVGMAVRSSANQFGILSDRAAQAGASAQQLNALVSGLGIAGAKGANLDAVSDALARMTKATGRTGMQGLAQTLADVAALGDEGQRIAELSRIFGRTFGPGMAALVREGPDAARASIEKLIAAGPRLSDSLVSAGDAIADGMKAAQDNIKAGWNSAWVSVGQSFADHFGKPSRQFWADLGAYVRYGIEVAFRYVANFAQNVLAVFRNFGSLWHATFDELGAIIARNLLNAWHSVSGWAERVAARFVWLKDIIAAAFTDSTFAEANAKLDAALAASRERVAANKAVVDAMLGDASFANIAEAFKRAGVTLEVDTADLENGLAQDLAKNASGILDEVQGVGALFNSAASTVASSLGPVRNAQAVLANTYDAYKILHQSPAQSGEAAAQKAAVSTASNTAETARNTAELSRYLEKISTALDSGGMLYTLA